MTIYVDLSLSKILNPLDLLVKGLKDAGISECTEIAKLLNLPEETISSSLKFLEEENISISSFEKEAQKIREVQGKETPPTPNPLEVSQALLELRERNWALAKLKEQEERSKILIEKGFLKPEPEKIGSTLI